jgi:hypothetical protein
MDLVIERVKRNDRLLATLPERERLYFMEIVARLQKAEAESETLPMRVVPE